MKSVKTYIDDLIDAVQDVDYYYGCTNGKADPMRMKRFKKAKQNIRQHIIYLRKQVKDLKCEHKQKE